MGTDTARQKPTESQLPQMAMVQARPRVFLHDSVLQAGS